MSPRQLGSSHWTSAVYTETAGGEPSEQSPPPAAGRAQSGVPLRQLEGGAFRLFKGCPVLTVTVAFGNASEQKCPLTWHRGRKNPDASEARLGWGRKPRLLNRLPQRKSSRSPRTSPEKDQTDQTDPSKTLSSGQRFDSPELILSDKRRQSTSLVGSANSLQCGQ